MTTSNKTLFISDAVLELLKTEKTIKLYNSTPFDYAEFDFSLTDNGSIEEYVLNEAEAYYKDSNYITLNVEKRMSYTQDGFEICAF